MEAILAFLKNDQFLVLLGALFLVVEYVLGKTDLLNIKEGSILEVALSFVKKVLSLFGIGNDGPTPKSK